MQQRRSDCEAAYRAAFSGTPLTTLQGLQGRCNRRSLIAWRGFGRRKSYAAGERLVATGEIAPGAFVILEGRVDVLQRGGLGPSQLIVTRGPGSFMGELAQLSDRPSLVDA